MINQSKYEPLSIRANMAWNAIGSIVNLGCQWLISILVVRLSTGFDDAGLYSLAVAIFGVFSPISQYRIRYKLVTQPVKILLVNICHFGFLLMQLLLYYSLCMRR